MSEPAKEILRDIPSVSEFLQSDDGESLCREFGEGLVKFELRRHLSALREKILVGEVRKVPALEDMAYELRARVSRYILPEGREAVNATGIMLHTGLGRAPMSEQTVNAFSIMGGYSVLQTSVETGKRSMREEKIEALLCELTGCEAATVVNNNAAATMLVLNELAGGREVVVSRGQLIEIGGAFRLPDVMKMSGAVLRDIGCTNRTHLRDYENAITEETGALIHVHTSNYRVRGFSGTPGIEELAPLAKKHGLAMIDDLGSGALVPLSEWGISNEPLVKDSVKAGADVMCFSGDKLICGPQSGIILGRSEIIKRIRKNPFARMFRVCKLTLAGLETALTHFVNGDFREKIPFYRMLSLSLDALDARAAEFMRLLMESGVQENVLSVGSDFSYVGSGSIPDEGVESRVVRVDLGAGAEEAARLLRKSMPSVFCRINDNCLIFDMRTVFDADFGRLAGVVAGVVR